MTAPSCLPHCARSPVTRWLMVGIGLAIGGLGYLAAPATTLAQAVLAQDFNEQLDIRPFNGTAEEERLPLREEADRLVVVGGQQNALGEYEYALEFWQQAAAIYDVLDDFQALGRTRDYIGLTYGELARFTEAEAALRQRLAIARDNSDETGQIYGWNNLGTVLLQRGSLRAAEECFLEAQAIAADIQDPDGLGAALSNLGLVQAARGDYETAIELYEQATRLRYQGLDERGRAHTSNNMGDAYRAVGNYFRSAAGHRTALNIARELGDRAMQLRAIDGLIATYQLDNQPQFIPGLLTERAAVVNDSGDAYQAMRTLIALGDFYLENGQSDRAYAVYRPAYDLAVRLNEPQTAARLKTALANLALVITLEE